MVIAAIKLKDAYSVATLYTQVQSMRRTFTKGSEGGEDRKDK